jgi:hypothetical protein
VDVCGPHKLGTAKASRLDVQRLYAYWAFSKGCRVFPPRDGSVEDVTDKVLDHIKVVQDILDDNPELLAKGREFKETEEGLNQDSLVRIERVGDLRIAVRKADGFVNHLYTTVIGEECEGVLALNEKFKSVTLSWSEEGQGDACRTMQAAFGPEAGGHKGIAGSPRGQEMSWDDLERVILTLKGES